MTQEALDTFFKDMFGSTFVYAWDQSEGLKVKLGASGARDYELVTFAQLQAISEAFGTIHINIHYEEETGDYSEYTAGDPSQVWISISRITKEPG